MKKIIMVMVATCMVALSGTAYGQTKAEIKSAKAQAKTMQQAGWTNGDAMSNLSTLLIEWASLRKDNLTYIGRADNKANETIANNDAMQDAITQSIRVLETEVKGVNSQVQGTLSGESIDNMTTEAISTFSGRIAKGMRRHATLYKHTNGKVSAQGYYYIDKKLVEEMISEYQKKAAQAKKDAQATSEHTQAVQESVNKAHANK